MRKRIFILLSIALVVNFLLISPKVSIAGSQPITKIDILTNPFGSSGYVLSFALAELINKNSTWLRASCMETKSTRVNVMNLAVNPEKRKNTLVYSAVYTNLQASRGEAPFPKPYTGLKWVAKTILVGIPIFSSDPKIRGPESMIGKRIGLGPKGATTDVGPAAVLKAWGILDKVKISNLAWSPAKMAFLDGTIDVTIMAIVDIGGGNWKPTPVGAEILASQKPVYFIDQDDKACQKARELTGYPIYPWVVPAGALGPKQPEPVVMQSQCIAWFADSAMDEKIVYEVSRIIWENAEKFREKHATGRGITKENIHMVPGLTEKDMHPGALKFAREKELKIGIGK